MEKWKKTSICVLVIVVVLSLALSTQGTSQSERAISNLWVMTILGFGIGGVYYYKSSIFVRNLLFKILAIVFVLSLAAGYLEASRSMFGFFINPFQLFMANLPFILIETEKNSLIILAIARGILLIKEGGFTSQDILGFASEGVSMASQKIKEVQQLNQANLPPSSDKAYNLEDELKQNPTVVYETVIAHLLENNTPGKISDDGVKKLYSFYETADTKVSITVKDKKLAARRYKEALAKRNQGGTISSQAGS